MTGAVVLAIALVMDAALGEPRVVWTRIPHPAVMTGRLVAFLDKGLNQGNHRQLNGLVAVLLLVAVAGAVGALLEEVPAAPVVKVIVTAILLAQRSLVDHVRKVAHGLHRSLVEGRSAVSHIVGRDVEGLNESGVARAAIESAAENFSDGVIAPAFWFLVCGLPGLLIYKAVNTADSMIGYRTPRYRAFGWAAARLDDVLNWLPARLSALLILVACGLPKGWGVVRRDAVLHRSPNAGWPEAAMAACLGVALSGPRSYGGEIKNYQFVHPEGRKTLTADDVDRSVRVLWKSWAVFLVMVVALALV